MLASRRSTATTLLVLSVLVVSTLGAIAILTPRSSETAGPLPSVNAVLSVYNGPTCTATVSSENVQNNAIQSVINTYASTSGVTICLGSGTFPEQLTINGTTDLTLWGDGNTSTILAPATLDVNQLDLDSGNPTYAIIGAYQDSGLTIANLQINGTSAAASAAGCANYNGIYYAATSGTIENDLVTAINQNDGCQGQNAIVVNNGYFTTSVATALSVAITDNTVTSYGKNGITCNDPGVVCTISGNTVGTTPMPLGYSATNGIQFYGATGTITDNTVTGNNYLPAWCGAGNYFYAGGGSCQGNALAEATGILLYAPGNGANASGNYLAGNQIALADIGGPVAAWDNDIASAGFYGIVLDFNATPGWLGSALYSTGPYAGAAGGNVIDNANVGVLVYDDNATLTANRLADVNVSFEASYDLPVAYQLSLLDNVADSNLSGALLGTLASYQPGDSSAPVAAYTLTDNDFVNASVASTGAPNGVLISGQSATLTDDTVTGFDNAITTILSPSGDLAATGNVLTAPSSPPAGNGGGLYAFAGTATIASNSISGWSWMNGPGWWPNSQTAGLFAQCLNTCDVTGNDVTDNAIGIAVISYLYGPSPAPSWPFAAPPSNGPVAITSNDVSDSGAFGIALELNQGPSATTDSPSVTIASNTVDNTATGAVGLMVDQGTYAIDDNTFLGTSLTGSSGASQPTGVGSIGTADVQVLNAYDYRTIAALQGNAFFDTLTPLALLNVTGAGAFANASYGETVNFTESGLPASTTWYLNVSGLPSDGLSTPGFFLDLQNGSYTYTARDVNPTYHAVTPSATLLVAGGSIAQPVPFALTTYDATFTESGLPASTDWGVMLGATLLSSTSTTVQFSLTNGTYDYTIEPIAGYAVTGSYSGQLTIAGAADSVSVAWTQVTYTVAFDETGLAAGTSWTVNLGAQTATSTSTTNDFQAPNGTYMWSITPIAGYTTTWTGLSTTVNGASVTIDVVFTVVVYPVVIKETGLAPGTSWQFTVDSTTESTTGTQLDYNLTNGSYAYQVGVVPGYARDGVGTIDVNGAPAHATIAFVLELYTVTFKEKHLPGGTLWSVTFDSSTQSSSASTIVYQVANGSYAYDLGVVSGYHSTRSASGTVNVNGANEKIVFRFVVTKYRVTFTETGLPAATVWGVHIGAQSLASSGHTLLVNLKNNTYSFHVIPPAGYTATPSNGHLTVNGARITQSITFV